GSMTSSSPKQTPKRRSHTERVELAERRMFDATEALILEVGTQKTTLKEVGERAGYSRGQAHARFGSKEELFLRLADRCRNIWLEELDLAAGNKRGLAAFLSRMDAMVSYANRYPSDARVMYILWFESVGSPSAMKTGLSRFHAQAREDIQHLIEQARQAGEVAEDIDPAEFAMHFTSTLFGMSYQWVVNPSAVEPFPLINAIRRQMLLILRPTNSAGLDRSN
ncbi:MAG: TetR/AcrR family transcriptional regulator, partial [Pseudomonadota bacterium]